MSNNNKHIGSNFDDYLLQGLKNDHKLERVAEMISSGLQEIQDYLGARNNKKGRIRFPRGYIKRASHHKSNFWFISDQVVKDNLSYNLIVADVYKWIANRTNLRGIAKDMLVKQGIVLMGSIAETVLQTAMKGIIGKKHKFKERTKRMMRKSIISNDLKNELDWLWDKRKKIHIYLSSMSEFQHYKVSDYNLSLRIIGKLRLQLDEYFAT